MGEVVGFPKKEDGGPHLEGPFKCARCQHTWHGVAPVGMFNGFECPTCGHDTGAITGMIVPDAERWVCRCGNDLFHLDRKGAPMCCNCGIRATGWVDAT